MNSSLLNTIKLVLLYIHTYTNMWCMVMGYILFFGLIAHGDIITFEYLRAIGLLMGIIIIFISLFATRDFEDDLYKNFGIIRAR